MFKNYFLLSHDYFLIFQSNASTSGDWLNSEKDEKKEVPEEVVEKPKTGEEEEMNIYQVSKGYNIYLITPKIFRLNASFSNMMLKTRNGKKEDLGTFGLMKPMTLNLMDMEKLDWLLDLLGLKRLFSIHFFSPKWYLNLSLRNASKFPQILPTLNFPSSS